MREICFKKEWTNTLHSHGAFFLFLLTWSCLFVPTGRFVLFICWFCCCFVRWDVTGSHKDIHGTRSALWMLRVDSRATYKPNKRTVNVNACWDANHSVHRTKQPKCQFSPSGRKIWRCVFSNKYTRCHWCDSNMAPWRLYACGWKNKTQISARLSWILWIK